jgi:hypothetical protein
MFRVTSLGPSQKNRRKRKKLRRGLLKMSTPPRGRPQRLRDRCKRMKNGRMSLRGRHCRSPNCPLNGCSALSKVQTRRSPLTDHSLHNRNGRVAGVHRNHRNLLRRRLSPRRSHHSAYPHNWACIYSGPLTCQRKETPRRSCRRRLQCSWRQA